jgi:hypothetical protein
MSLWYRTRSAGPTIVVAGSLFACSPFSSSAPTFDFALSIDVQVDPTTPIPGTSVIAEGLTTMTDPAGRANLTLRGRDGDRREITVRCPADYQSPSPLVLTLQRHKDLAARPVYQAICRPLKRAVVVAARLRNGAGLPLLYLGRRVASADSDGVAHALLEVPLGEPVTLTVSTSDKPRIRPLDPEFVSSSSNADELLIIDQSFTVEPEKSKTKKKRAPSGPPRPTRI